MGTRTVAASNEDKIQKNTKINLNVNINANRNDCNNSNDRNDNDRNNSNVNCIWSSLTFILYKTTVKLIMTFRILCFEYPYVASKETY
jgi:hypothetical protein